MKVRQIEFPFKGTRNYIQGPDIFNAMISARANTVINNIRFTVHDFVRSHLCQLHLTESKDALNNLQNIRARCQYDENGITHWLALTKADGDAASAGRYEYNEEPLIALCHLEKEIITLSQQSPFTFIETIVAMNKHMHQQLFPEVAGKWIFTRIDLNAFCDERENLALHFKHNMNYRLTKSDILVNGNKAGDLYFSLVKS